MTTEMRNGGITVPDPRAGGRDANTEMAPRLGKVDVKPGKATIIYSIPTPDDSPMGGADTAEITLNGRVMNSVHPGGAEGIRTPDPLLAKQVLSQLSYSPDSPQF